MSSTEAFTPTYYYTRRAITTSEGRGYKIASHARSQILLEHARTVRVSVCLRFCSLRDLPAPIASPPFFYALLSFLSLSADCCLLCYINMLYVCLWCVTGKGGAII